MSIDVSIVLNVHREQNLLLPTLYSLRDAAAYARCVGVRVELVCVFDCSDELTRIAFAKVANSSFDDIVVLETSHASLPLARNSGCAAARGKYVSLCDGDDLVSFNWLSEMYFEAERRGPMTVLFPEWLFTFGDTVRFARYFDLRHLTPFAFIDSNPYTSRAFFDKRALNYASFSFVEVSQSYAYEDWHFNCEMAASGMDFRVAQDTILFYRMRDGLLARSDRESVGAIAPSRLFDPETFVKVCDKWESQEGAGLGKASGGFVSGPVCHLLVNAAERIDPQVELHAFRACKEYLSHWGSNQKTGRSYLDICKIVGAARFQHVFLLPRIMDGHRERYIADLMQALYRLGGKDRILVLLGEPGTQGGLAGQMSLCGQVFDLSMRHNDIGDAGIDLITLKLIQSCAPDAIVHLRPSVYAHRFFRRYAGALKRNKFLSYRLGDDLDQGEEHQGRAGATPSFIAEHEMRIDLCVTDSPACAERAQNGRPSDRWFVLPMRRDESGASYDKSVSRLLEAVGDRQAA